MNCYVCQTEGRTTPSVALCPQCQAALCLKHVRETAEARTHQPGPLACTHTTWSTAPAV